ncbi:MAG TPA: hypothetical protein VH165_17110 [Kofleriaceae bacterium]|jgi:hypothetical protein|nr:hypothetical protein [Kofleriaceae bacterium]
MKRLLAVCLLAACGTSPSTEAGDAADPVGTQADPVPFKTGPYEVVNSVDFTVEAILPAQAELVVSTLRALSTDPAHALITIADEAGVPAVGTLYGLIPGVIKDKLEGWINDEIAKVKIGGVPVTDYAGEIAGLADLALSHFAVDSELTIHGDTATHRITALDLTPAGLPLKLPISGLAGDLLTQEPTVTIGEGGALALGDQNFGLNYGEYAWQGLNAASQSLFGADIRGALGNAINCPALAHNVADKCVLDVCVGHETELTSICTGGLDAIVDLLHQRLAAMRLDAFHLASGQATLVDVDGDGVGDQITAGTWDAEMNLGQGLRHTPATFTGGR